MTPAESRSRSNRQSEIDRERALWAREMRRARVTARLLGALLLALVVVIVTGGLTVLLIVCVVVVVALLGGAVGLIRRGRRLEPGDGPHSPPPKRRGARPPRPPTNL